MHRNPNCTGYTETQNNTTTLRERKGVSKESYFIVHIVVCKDTFQNFASPSTFIQRKRFDCRTSESAPNFSISFTLIKPCMLKGLGDVAKDASIKPGKVPITAIIQYKENFLRYFGLACGFNLKCQQLLLK